MKKFKPIITKVKLNPEQAVLSCTCYMSGNSLMMVSPGTGNLINVGPGPKFCDGKSLATLSPDPGGNWSTTTSTASS